MHKHEVKIYFQLIENAVKCFVSLTFYHHMERPSTFAHCYAEVLSKENERG